MLKHLWKANQHSAVKLVVKCSVEEKRLMLTQSNLPMVNFSLTRGSYFPRSLHRLWENFALNVPAQLKVLSGHQQIRPIWRSE